MTELLQGKTVRGDLRMIGSAIRQGWDIPEDILEALPERVMAIVKREDASDKDKIAASKVLVSMLRENNKAAPNLHMHQHQVQPTGEDHTFEQKKAELLGRAARIGNN